MQIYSLILLYLAHIEFCLSYFFIPQTYQNLHYSYPQNRYVENQDFACCFYYYSPPAPMYIPQFQGAQFPVLAPFYLPYHTINYPSFGSHPLTGYAGYARYPSIYPGIKPVQASTQKPWRPTEASTVKPTTPIISPVEPVVPEVTTESSTLATLFKNKFSGATTTPGDIIDIDDEDISLKHDIDEVIEGSGGSATNDDED